MPATAVAAGNRHVVIAGVAGAGKTAVASALSERLSVAFADADSYHSAESVAKMSRGEALSDADRAPWLERLAGVLGGDAPPVVLACSSLKRAYRDTLRAKGGAAVTFLLLDASAETLEARLRSREGHFAGPSLLASQLETLEVSDDVVLVDAEGALEDVVAAAHRALLTPGPG